MRTEGMCLHKKGSEWEGKWVGSELGTSHTLAQKRQISSYVQKSFSVVICWGIISTRLLSALFSKCVLLPYFSTWTHIESVLNRWQVRIDIQGRRSQTLYTAQCYGVVSHGLKLGVFGFCRSHTQKQMRPWSSCAMQYFTHVYLHTQTTVDAGGIPTWRTTVILITWKPRRPPIWAPCRDENGAGSGISRVCLCK